MATVRYAIVIETGPKGCSAWVPDLPGCVAAAKTEAGVRKLIREAIPFHLEGMRPGGEPIPQPTSLVEYVEVESVP